MKIGHLWLAVALSVGQLAPAAASAEKKGEPQPAYVVEVTIDGDTVEAGEVEKTDFKIAPVPGTPQLQPLFFEAVGDRGVVHAGVLGQACVRPPADPAGANGNAPANPPPARAEGKSVDLIVVPVASGAKEIVLYRRVSDDPETGRKELKRIKLP